MESCPTKSDFNMKQKKFYRRPKIGITTPDKNLDRAYPFLWLGVRLGGGRPIRLRRQGSLQRNDIQGLVLGGGTDIFPGLFQNDPKQDYLYDHKRDEMEIAWLKRAEKENLPVLAICRGAQMMNVMNKGTLHLDVSLAYETAHYPRALLRRIFYRKTVRIREGSHLRRILGVEHCRVNSMHTQSIDTVGDRLDITAEEENGVVQAIERPDHPFYIGVQFHPEFMPWRSKMRAIFRGLVLAAG